MAGVKGSEMRKLSLAVAAVAACAMGEIRAERFDYGRLLVEDGPRKGLKVEDNVRWLEEGKVPDYAVANVISWLSQMGADVAKFRERYRPVEPGLGEPLAKRKGFRLGYMLDISRDKVPTLETLKTIAALLGKLGFDEFQLYTEHAFAYEGHEAAWKNWTPVTSADVRALDAFCASQGVTLVPNQNSFGHMEKWLRHPEYRHLAETPDGYTVDWHPALKNRPPCAVCPTDEKTYEFLDGLYAQLLPNFSRAKTINVGCDEVWDIFDKNGRSAAKVREKGVARTYMDHMLRVHDLLAKRGFRMAFWADMALYCPELLDEIPKDSLALLWNYGSEYHDPGITAENEGRAIALTRRGLDFAVCPSTRTYGTWFGQTDRMKGNVSMMESIARKYGAKGLLITTWGDGGHRVPFLAEVPALVYAAARVRGEDPDDGALAAAIDRALGCRVGAALVELGRVDGKDKRASAKVRRQVRRADLASAPDWVKRGFAMFEVAADFIEGKSGCGARYRALWLADNRAGGLKESMAEIGFDNE